MDRKPIFVATHSRSCSTAFERIFMTRRDSLTCFHEPFGDAFYFSPEKISTAWQSWPADKIERSGRGHYTYDFVLRYIEDAIKSKDSTKRVFLKDMTYHIVPPSHSPNAIAPSLQYRFKIKPDEPPNPTLFPTSLLNTFSFVFLIRKPSATLPSMYRCFIPPLSAKTEQHNLDPTELGYREMRILFDYLYPPATRSSSSNNAVPILIDADDLLANPESILRQVCDKLRLPYSPSMLSWDTPEDHAIAEAAFKKYDGYHDDALNSTGLRPKTAAELARANEAKTRGEEDDEWTRRFGGEAARIIREAVDACQVDYEYLRQFRIMAEGGEDMGKGYER